MSDNNKTRVWDLPLRLFHWVLTVAVCISVYTGVSGGFNEMDYHMLSGYTVISLIVFRLAWGVLGSTYSRFSSFIKISAILPYIRELFRAGHKPSVGHNPLGGLSIVALLLVLTIQAGTGLFANDDIMLEGPLTHLVSDDKSDFLTSIHHINIKVLYVLLSLHLIAIGFYELIKKERLVGPMITGWKKVSGNPLEKPGHTSREMIVGACVALVASGFTYYLVNYL